MGPKWRPCSMGNRNRRTQPCQHVAHIPRESFRGVVAFPTAALRKPCGEREVLQRHHGLERTVAQLFHDPHVVIEGICAEFAVDGFYAAPLY